MKPKKARQINVRIDEATGMLLDDFEARTGMEAVTLARTALTAALQEFQRGGTLSFPLRIQSLKAMTAEELQNRIDQGKAAGGLGQPMIADFEAELKARESASEPGKPPAPAEDLIALVAEPLPNAPNVTDLPARKVTYTSGFRKRKKP